MPGEVFSADTNEAREGKMNDLGKILKQARVTAGMTLRDLAAQSGVSTSQLARMERGERFPSARILHKIAKPLGLTEDELFAHAGYLSPRVSTTEGETVIGRLDPYVASVLAQETVETQRTVIGILTILKSLGGILRDNPGELSEFREYARRKYPNLSEDLVTMIEDLIAREAESRNRGRK